MKTCVQCKETKSKDNFYSSKGTKDGFRTECKSCGVENSKQNRNKIIAMWDNGELKRPEYKKCPSCKEIKSSIEFETTKYNRSGLYPYCMDCNKRRFKTLRESKKEQIMYGVIKKRAKDLGLPFDLDKSDIKIPDYCPVLGIKIERNNSAFKGSSPSVDRIIPSKGYTKGNIVVISNRANIIKRDATIDELIKVAKFYSELNLD